MNNFYSSIARNASTLHGHVLQRYLPRGIPDTLYGHERRRQSNPINLGSNSRSDHLEDFLSVTVMSETVISHFDGQMGLNGSGESQQQIDITEYCEEHSGNGVICFTPSEDATIGEAFAVREIAAQESWDTVTVVTSRWHAFRAHYIFEQCVGDDIDVNLVHADADEFTASDWFWHLAYENAAFFKALWQTTTRC